MASSSSLNPDDGDIAFGSDETFQHLCDICKDDKHVEAKAFCTNCSQRLCFKCQKSHNRIEATKDHDILTGENVLLIVQSFGQGAEQSWGGDNNQSSGQSRRTDNSQGTEQLWRAVNSHGGSEQSWRADDTEHNVRRGSEQILNSRQSSGQPLRIQDKPRDIINIEEFDTGSVEVSAMEIAMKGNLLVCDYGNHKLMLFDSKYEPLSAVYLLSAPWSMALSTPRNAILSLPDTPCLQMVELDNLDRLTLGQAFQTTNKFHRLLKYNDDMIALSEDKKCHTFSIIDIKGNIKRSIRREMKESDMFKTIYFIALSRDQSILYVIDFYKGCYGLTMSGEIIFKYTDKKMKDYVGIATDTENFLYISGPETNSIVVINSEGKKVKDLVTLEGMRPGLITYDALQAKLFVKKFFGSRIFVFTLTNKGCPKTA